MHIPDNYLSPSTCTVMTAAVVPAWVHSVRKLKAEFPKEKMVLLGVGAAFSFLGMMFNIPMPGGTTGHAVGGTLIALLLGPEAACIAVTIALLIQALLFGDGGILAFGANCFNMAFVLPYVGYYSYKLLRKALGVDRQLNQNCHAEAKLLGADFPDETGLRSAARKDKIAAGLSSYLGINAAALMAAIEFGIQPLLFCAEDGTPLYCPYGLSVSIPAMMFSHLTIFGLAEVIFTVAVYSFLGANSNTLAVTGNAYVRVAVPNNPELSGISNNSALATNPGNSALAGNSDSSASASNPGNSDNNGFGSKKAGILLGVLILATPLGLIAAGTAWGEWDIAEIPTMTENFSWNALMPDYALEGIPDVATYILSAVIGVALVILIFRIIGALIKDKTEY